jgi:hypothetical protein
VQKKLTLAVPSYIVQKHTFAVPSYIVQKLTFAVPMNPIQNMQQKLTPLKRETLDAQNFYSIRSSNLIA